MSAAIETKSSSDRAEALVGELRALVSFLTGIPQDLKLSDKREQLKEVGRSIGRLESLNVSVPDELRALKTQLISELSVEEHIQETLSYLGENLEEILCQVRPRSNAGNGEKPRKPRSKLPKTDKNVLREHLILALKANNGRARIDEVLDWMANELNGKLLPGDLETRSTGEIVWQNNTCWERFTLVREGVLKSDSPRGIWELAKQNYVHGR
jgi:hypothetical protein